MRRRWTFRDIRGEELEIAAPYYVVSHSGTGIAPAQHVTQRDVYQDGETFVYGRYDARTVHLGIDILADEPKELPALRDALYRMLAPLKYGCYLSTQREDGSKREIQARLLDELAMPHQAGDGAAVQRVVLSLRAAQPHWHDPQTTLWVYNVGGGVGSFGFPVGFPAGFGVSTVDIIETRTYSGHIDVYPEIRVTGPATNLVIENVTLGAKLDLSLYTIMPGEVVTFHLAGMQKRITSSDVGPILEYLSDDSQLGPWRILAHPEAASGRNRVRVYLENATNATEVVIQFNALYAGA